MSAAKWRAGSHCLLRRTPSIRHSFPGSIACGSSEQSSLLSLSTVRSQLSRRNSCCCSHSSFVGPSSSPHNKVLQLTRRLPRPARASDRRAAGPGVDSPVARRCADHLTRGEREGDVLYMIVESFRGGDAIPVYRRFRHQGRLAPDGLRYVASWVSNDFQRCFQVMEL